MPQDTHPGADEVGCPHDGQGQAPPVIFLPPIHPPAQEAQL